MTKNKILLTLILGIFLFGIIAYSHALELSSFSVSPEEVAPGKTADISILLKNTGNEDAENVNVNLDLSAVPIAPYNSGSDYSLDSIDADESKRASFQIVALNDAKAGIYKIPVIIKYNEDNLTITKSSLISVLINSNPVLEASVEDGLLLKGKQDKMSVKIVNRGLGDVKFLDITLGTGNGYTILSSSKVYIGDVDSNDFQSTEYNIFFKDAASDTVIIPVSMNYQDITGKQYHQESVISAKVYSQADAVNLGLVSKSKASYYVLIIVVIVIIYIIYRVIRNRRKKKNGEI